MAAPRKEDFRARILTQTAALLQTTSFEAITLSGIAAAVGISKGTLYYYYNSKNDILLDICNEQIAALGRRFSQWADNPDKDTSAARLIRYVLQYGTGSGLGNLRLYLIGAAVSGHEDVRLKYIELYEAFKQTLTEKLHARMPHADAQHLAWVLLTVMDGILVQKQLGNPHFDAQQFEAQCVAMLCGAAGAQAGDGTDASASTNAPANAEKERD